MDPQSLATPPAVQKAARSLVPAPKEGPDDTLALTPPWRTAKKKVNGHSELAWLEGMTSTQTRTHKRTS